MIYILIIIALLLILVGIYIYRDMELGGKDEEPKGRNAEKSKYTSNIHDQNHNHIYNLIQNGLSNIDIQQTIFADIKKQISQDIYGLDYVINGLIVSLISSNHILLSGYPGLAKTSIVKSFANLLGYDWGRIQGSVDLQPSDIVGNNIYNPTNNQLEVKLGPINHQLVLVDEINRMTPKTQSALLQAMAENSITIDNNIYELPQPFMVLATMNPHDDYGTFPMSFANLDRFAMGIYISYPDNETEKQILNKSNNTYDINNIEKRDSLTYQQLQDIRKQIDNIYISDDLQNLIIKILDNSRKDESLKYGIGPRSSIYISAITKTIAWLEGSDSAKEDYIYMSLTSVLSHRISAKNNNIDKIQMIYDWCK